MVEKEFPVVTEPRTEAKIVLGGIYHGIGVSGPDRSVAFAFRELKPSSDDLLLLEGTNSAQHALSRILKSRALHDCGYSTEQKLFNTMLKPTKAIELY